LQAGEDFAEVLASLQKFERKKGDFGAEIIGTLLVPLLLEALKDVWAGYVKKLSEDPGEATAKFTADRLKSIFRTAFRGLGREALVKPIDDSLEKVAGERRSGGFRSCKSQVVFANSAVRG
jgi:hypothetical protein